MTDTEDTQSKPPLSRPYLPPPPGEPEDMAQFRVPRTDPPPASLWALIPESEEGTRAAPVPGDTLRAVLTFLVFSLLAAGGYFAYSAAF